MAITEQSVSTIYPVAGVRLSAVAANIRYADRLDLVLIEIKEGSRVSGVFTQNAFCAAPVNVSKKHLLQMDSRYFLINTGNANAGTGKEGELAARDCCQTVADTSDVELQQVLPFSTGVIGEALAVEKIQAAIPQAFNSLNENNWSDAATGILTTDTRPKIASTQIEINGERINITGIAKGSGMIKPNMATMLAYVFTDANIEKQTLNSFLNSAVEKSFNRLTVDGDTSTNDCCMLVATGENSASKIEADTSQAVEFSLALDALFIDLAKGLIKDAEGATKFVTIKVSGGANADECLAVAYTVAESPLVKTALFASDPNWGRILAAIGRAGLNSLDIGKVSISLGNVCLVSGGAIDSSYTEELGQSEMNKEEILIDIGLARGDAQETVWTSDLSHEYVRINAEYRS
ncbi:MAG: bifunctional glutamate N-acetyltransferase/amino-acid acetyltransferase ArgJ [Gammaproteobacteria bacterium]|jgi:glutamate N-acetyltransferase/amino-acid N-acetyltransferase|nr:bifunctional glutamate N-acetyltransferase/amino-acid acetyltransferase ArgJ [Gammaproteobacteria bacterium]MBT3859962.1 bifunctional glutamate N-acetyltransferase/amino-acid acetyltransferase ArgJ [Gammaproteobacteria bacterium]MBT3986424.1 bifunctional glutamate N-acetyltransferase/amino-acid acetyltransferase ArgJ [Gammaproteobacteria bacterium]MBT4254826.1 bifunctional glutamate N-acetyltransferase/amino-acid acetyltransferase ArgJ [Gammaproteobacteria bacterium]MBT4582984.1 bifunctional